MNDVLKEQIQTEIDKEEARDVSLETAAQILGIKSIDQEHKRLIDEARDGGFQYNHEKASQGLRPYQQEAIKKLDELFESHEPVFALQLPTGAGKTFTIHSFVYDKLLKKNRNVLVVTPSWEIANQHAMTLAQCFEDGRERVRRLGGKGQLISVFEEYKRADKGKVIITTAALFFARHERISEQLKVDLVVIDEGHHGWRKLRLNSVQKFAAQRGASLVLLTATPPANMENLPFAAQIKYLDLVPQYLVKCQVIRLETGEPFDPVLRRGVLTQASRLEISRRKERFEKIVRDSIPHMKGKTIYFAGSVREAMGVLREFEKLGVTATVVHSKWTSKSEKINQLAIERFRKGEARVLVNVQMLAMGFDVPDVETIIVARPVESDILFTQMVGRGARPTAGKEEFILIDVHDTIFKPEVAKIFEHKNVFYSSTAEPKVIRRPARPNPIRATVLKLPVRNKEFGAPNPFAFQRSSVVLDYFLKDVA